MQCLRCKRDLYILEVEKKVSRIQEPERFRKNNIKWSQRTQKQIRDGFQATIKCVDFYSRNNEKTWMHSLNLNLHFKWSFWLFHEQKRTEEKQRGLKVSQGHRPRGRQWQTSHGGWNGKQRSKCTWDVFLRHDGQELVTNWVQEMRGNGSQDNVQVWSRTTECRKCCVRRKDWRSTEARVCCWDHTHKLDIVLYATRRWDTVRLKH